MKKTWSKLLALVLALVLCVSLLPIAALAGGTETVTIKKVVYTDNGNGTCSAAITFTYSGNKITYIDPMIGKNEGSYEYDLDTKDVLNLPEGWALKKNEDGSYTLIANPLGFTGGIGKPPAGTEAWVGVEVSTMDGDNYSSGYGQLKITVPGEGKFVEVERPGGSGGETKPEEQTKPEHNLSIDYMDKYGNTVATSYGKKYAEGASYNVPSPTVAGMTAKKSSVEGTMRTADISETVYYVLNDTEAAKVDEVADEIKKLLPEDADKVGVDDKENVEKAVALYDQLSQTQKSLFQEKYPDLYKKLNTCAEKLNMRLKTKYEPVKKTSGKKWKATVFRIGKRKKTVTASNRTALYIKVGHIASTSAVKKVVVTNNQTGKKTTLRGYRIKPGSTIIYLDGASIDALDPGIYTLTTTFEDGYSETEFAVDVAVFDKYAGSEDNDDVLLAAGEGYSFTAAYYVGADAEPVALAADAYSIEKDTYGEYTLTLKKEYLSTLAVGEHTFSFGLLYTDEIDEEVTLTLTVKDSTPSASYGGGAETVYKITVAEAEGGKVTASRATAPKGAKVTLTVEPDKGFDLDELKVVDAKGNEITVTDGAFTMPASDVTVTATFKEIPKERPFTDVKEGDWFYDAVYYCYDMGWFKGTGTTTFDPQGTMTRAMFATVLWRIAGEPAPTGTDNPFEDVKAGEYYYDAVLWAVGQGITNGVDEAHFDPEAPVTRAQAVTLLYRYEQSIGKGFTGLWAFQLDYPDAEDVPEWAYEAFCWMVSEDICKGSDGKLLPDEPCRRCEVVALLARCFAE